MSISLRSPETDLIELRKKRAWRRCQHIVKMQLQDLITFIVFPCQDPLKVGWNAIYAQMSRKIKNHWKHVELFKSSLFHFRFFEMPFYLAGGAGAGGNGGKLNLITKSLKLPLPLTMLEYELKYWWHTTKKQTRFWNLLFHHWTFCGKITWSI